MANFDISVSRSFSHDGEQHSYLSASCPVPKGFTAGFLSFARATYLRGWKTAHHRVRAQLPGLVNRLPASIAAALLRIKRVQGADDVWGLFYSGDRRLTFRHGPERKAGETHVVWLRVSAATTSSRGPQLGPLRRCDLGALVLYAGNARLLARPWCSPLVLSRARIDRGPVRPDAQLHIIAVQPGPQ